MSGIVGAYARPIFVWYGANSIPLTETLKFSLLQLREHLDTLCDRKDQANEVRNLVSRSRFWFFVLRRLHCVGFQCLETLKAILKLQQLRDESVRTRLLNEESVVDVGRVLYKFYVQLLSLLETANRMYSSLISTSNQSQVSL